MIVMTDDENTNTTATAASARQRTNCSTGCERHDWLTGSRAMHVVIGGAAATRRVGGHDLEKQGRRDFYCCGGGGEDVGQLSQTAAAAGRRPSTPSVGLRDGNLPIFKMCNLFLSSL